MNIINLSLKVLTRQISPFSNFFGQEYKINILKPEFYKEAKKSKSKGGKTLKEKNHYRVEIIIENVPS